MLAGERKMVFLPSDGATEDQVVPKGGRADHHRGVRHCVGCRDRARPRIAVVVVLLCNQDLPTKFSTPQQSPYPRTGTYHTRERIVRAMQQLQMLSTKI